MVYLTLKIKGKILMAYASLEDWFKRAENGTSGDMVHDILYSWKEDLKRFEKLIDVIHQCDCDCCTGKCLECSIGKNVLEGK